MGALHLDLIGYFFFPASRNIESFGLWFICVFLQKLKCHHSPFVVLHRVTLMGVYFCKQWDLAPCLLAPTLTRLLSWLETL